MNSVISQRGLWARALRAGLILLCVAGVLASAANAQAARPVWAIRAPGLPTNFSPAANEGCINEASERCDVYVMTATDVGGAATDGTTVHLKDVLPAGVSVVKLYSLEELNPGEPVKYPVTCTGESLGSTVVSCEYTGSMVPGSMISVTINVIVEAPLGTTLVNSAEVEGGGASRAVAGPPTTMPNLVSSGEPSFGVHAFGVTAYGPDGQADVQAGSHPESLSTSITLNSRLETTEHEGFEARFQAIEEQKTEIVNLPLGLSGDPLAVPTCRESTLRGTNEGTQHCPPGSRVGTVELEWGGQVHLFPIFNVVPEPGYPAEFGFELVGTVVLVRARVLPSPDGYVLSVAAPDIPRSIGVKVSGATLTFFGDPAEVDGSFTPPAAMFTNPSDCSSGPLGATLELDSWVNPQGWSQYSTGVYEASAGTGVSGCNLLQFDPRLAVTPERAQADEPSGYGVELSVAQPASVAPILAPPDLRDAAVTMPSGVVASPAVASGLVACQERGAEGIELGGASAPSHEPEEGEAIGPDTLPTATPGHCPLASRLGEVEVVTPVLPQPLRGHLFLAQPQCGGVGAAPCSEADVASGKLAPVYLEAAGSGIIIKLKGQVTINPVNGQLTTSFDENPQFPFSSLKISLYGGSRAPLANPQTCGAATVLGQLLPWSAPETGAAATPTSTFGITGCNSGFAPSFLAQAASPVAGAHTPFQLTLTRKDGEPDLASVGVSMPRGLLGTLASVTQCPEPAASQGACGAGSLIGHVDVAAGSGTTPFWTTGDVFLTGPYRGGPFGLSIVVPTVAGPFRLAGNNGMGSEVVRAAIYVNPSTAAITVDSDPIPQIVDGIQLRIKTMSISIDREGFMFNPTNCNQQQVVSSVGSAFEGGAAGPTASVSAPFAVTGCKDLPFKPAFTAATSGKTSKADGASLRVRVVPPSEGPQSAGSGEANIARVKVELPKALPSRLTTLQQACTAAQFAANPAMCPAASVVGAAVAHSPVLSSPLTGPAYFVSHGGEAFPQLIIVLQGEGVTVELVGDTFISKAGITSSTFASVPDVPVSSFELTLPEGKYSALAANGKLCAQALSMPTEFVGQNGAVFHQSTPIDVEGCSSSIAVVSHSIKGRKLTVSISVPTAGKLAATGRGLSKAAKTSKGRETIKLSLHTTKAGKLHTKIKLTFTPNTGKGRTKQTKTVTVEFKK
jgi:hypothetical protein